MNKNIGRQPEFYISILSLLLSLAAFYTSVVQTNIMQTQQKASVWPFVEITHGVQTNEYYLKVKNKGVGPAIIKQVDFNFQGKSYPVAMDCAQAIINDTAFHAWHFSSYPFNKSVFAANEEIEALRINDLRFVNQLLKNGEGFNFKVRYASIYGDEWETDGQNTEKVK
jgi:hypothetical protein